MNEKPRRYEKVKSHPGIRKDNSTGKFEAYKKVNRIRYSATFERLMDARQWRLSFVPVVEKLVQRNTTLGELIDLYKKEYVPTLALSTQGVRLDRIKIFKDLEPLKVEKITPEQVQRFFQGKANKSREMNSRRMNFDGEIKDLKAILNWYRENINYQYVVPIITKRLKASCTISKEKRVKEKLSAEEFIMFFNALEPFYKDVALIQSRIAGRVGEIAGLQFQSIDLKSRTLLVKHVVVYGRKKEFVELKANPKSGEIRRCHITDDILEVINRRRSVQARNSDYVFHIDGEPLKYRSVQHAYDHALKKVGLISKTSGTHMIRHFTATLTRLVCGNLDAVQSVTGHKSFKLVEHYGALASNLQSDSISKVELYLKQKSQEMNQGCAMGVQNLS